MALVRALFLLGPGLALTLLLDRGGPRPRWLEAPLLAAAAWVVLSGWLSLLPGSWALPFALLGAAWWVFAVREGARRRLFALDAGSAVCLAAAAVLCALLGASVRVPPGVDAAMHGAVARILGEASGHPAGFRPLWPLDGYHSYPVGQPALTALLQLCTGATWRAASLWSGALACALVVCALAAAVSRLDGGSARGLWLGAGAVLIARAPLHFWTWGGLPNALGMAFAVAGFARGVEAALAARRADRRPGAARPAAACALFAAAALLTHAVSVAALGAAGALLFLGFAAREPRRAGRASLPLLAAGALAVLLAGPFLLTLRPVLGPRELEWVRSSSREAVQGTFLGAVTLPVRILHDIPAALGAAALLLLLWRAPRRAGLPLGLAAALFALILNGLGSWLPGSVLLYPDRIAALLLLPFAIAGCRLLEALEQARTQGGLPRWTAHKLARLALAAGLVALAGHALNQQRKLLRNGREHALLVADDEPALGQAGRAGAAGLRGADQLWRCGPVDPRALGASDNLPAGPSPLSRGGGRAGASLHGLPRRATPLRPG